MCKACDQMREFSDVVDKVENLDDLKRIGSDAEEKVNSLIAKAVADWHITLRKQPKWIHKLCKLELQRSGVMDMMWGIDKFFEYSLNREPDLLLKMVNGFPKNDEVWRQASRGNYDPIIKEYADELYEDPELKQWLIERAMESAPKNPIPSPRYSEEMGELFPEEWDYQSG